MTRINVGIPPADLVNQHLIAEHREIKRIAVALEQLTKLLTQLAKEQN